MKKTVGLALLISVCPLITSVDALAGIINTSSANTSTLPYKFSSFTMPSSAGGQPGLTTGGTLEIANNS